MGGTTFTGTIPYDVLYCVMEFLDMGSLKTANLVSHDFKSVADRYIWRSFRIVVERPRVVANGSLAHDGRHICEVFKEGCRIACASTRASRIRNFRVKVYEYTRPASDEAVILETLFGALRLFTSLRRLEIDLVHFRRHHALISTLTHYDFPFRLDHLAFHMLGLDPRVNRLLSSQKHITSLHLYSDSRAHQLDEESLPHLTYLHIKRSSQIVVARNRPVTHLCIDPSIERGVFPDISQSTLPLQYLWWSVYGDWVMESLDGMAANPSIAAAALHVRYLVLDSSDPIINTRALKLFSNLEEFVVETNLSFQIIAEQKRLQLEVEKQFFKDCSEYCVYLHKVTFLYRLGIKNDLIPNRTYRRKELGEKWEVAEEHHGIERLFARRHLFPAMPY